jgi:Sec-independent protein translocase protein TatA
MKDLGKGVKAFRDGMSDEDKKSADVQVAPPVPPKTEV